ncbi:hypothetical protein JTY60_02520 [symbiont of Argiope bruennichi]|uniref:hypothetical protein n=1 Tax=symbiont of Argiope bruennichi TaxID=2810479 RepID=UPI003DA5E896
MNNDNNFNQYLKKIKIFLEKHELILNFYQKKHFLNLFSKYKIKNYNLIEKNVFKKNTFLINIYADVQFKKDLFFKISNFEQEFLYFCEKELDIKITKVNFYIVNLVF